MNEFFKAIFAKIIEPPNALWAAIDILLVILAGVLALVILTTILYLIFLMIVSNSLWVSIFGCLAGFFVIVFAFIGFVALIG